MFRNVSLVIYVADYSVCFEMLRRAYSIVIVMS